MKHKNVAKLRAYHCSKNAMVFVYDYNNHDSVSAMLYGKRGAGRIHLDWETRVRIAVGAAKGIAYIHTQDGRTCVHGNIKASNIFLNKQQYGLVSDVGLAKLASPITLSNISTQGYYAPEVTDTRNVSQASDVYSFGVVLLELLSGKKYQRTTHNGKVISLVTDIHSLIREEWRDEVFDAGLLCFKNEEEVMVQVFQIAMKCVASVPKLRPKMAQVVNMFEEISGVDRERQPYIESTWEDWPRDILRAPLHRSAHVGKIPPFY